MYVGVKTAACTTNEHKSFPPPAPETHATRRIRALLIQPGNSRALVRRAQAYQELGFFRLTVEDLEAAEASVSAEMRHICRQGEETGGERAEALAAELAEVVKRLEHARWTKVEAVGGFNPARMGSSKAIFAQKEGALFSSSFHEAGYIVGLACCFAALSMLSVLEFRGGCVVQQCPSCCSY